MGHSRRRNSLSITFSSHVGVGPFFWGGWNVNRWGAAAAAIPFSPFCGRFEVVEPSLICFHSLISVLSVSPLLCTKADGWSRQAPIHRVFCSYWGYLESYCKSFSVPSLMENGVCYLQLSYSQTRFPKSPSQGCQYQVSSSPLCSYFLYKVHHTIWTLFTVIDTQSCTSSYNDKFLFYLTPAAQTWIAVLWAYLVVSIVSTALTHNLLQRVHRGEKAH